MIIAHHLSLIHISLVAGEEGDVHPRALEVVVGAVEDGVQLGVCLLYTSLVIDTSYSTSGELVRAFLAETYTLLKGRENVFHRMNLHLIQADNAVRQDIPVKNEDGPSRLILADIRKCTPVRNQNRTGP